MKIETYFEALQISEALKKLNLDITQMDPQTRVKIKDGVVMFEPEKECFVSKRTEGHQCPLVNEEPIKYDAGPQPEQLEYYYLKEGDIIEEGDEFEGYKDHWHKANRSVGFKIPRDNYGYRRKIQKNPTS